MNTDSFDLTVLGLGYIGLPTATMFANSGLRVAGYDVNEEVVKVISRGQIHIVEPGLGPLVEKVVQSGHLTASNEVIAADNYIIAVPTPFHDDTKTPDLSYVFCAVDLIANILKVGDLVILESTSPPGTTDLVAKRICDKRPDLIDTSGKLDIYVAYCPERVLPGKILEELKSNDRIIGGLTSACSRKATALYERFVCGECVTATSPKAAELTKLVENSFRDVNIAFANELSLICDDLGASVWEVIELANRHPRVNILQPGPGVGGHCIAVDPWFIVSSSKFSKLIKTARDINDQKAEWALKKILLAAEQTKSIGKPKVACFGLTFKPDIDDIRESPALKICNALTKMSEIELSIVEPHIDPSIAPQFYFEDAATALQSANLVVLLVDHQEFINLKIPLDVDVVDFRGKWKT